MLAGKQKAIHEERDRNNPEISTDVKVWVVPAASN
jgi:hypothetical protein